MAVDLAKGFTTYEDRILERFDALAEAIRDRPLLPVNSADSNAADTDVNSGRRWPLVHCSFKGCSWSKDLGKADRDPLLHHWGMEWCLFRSKIDFASRFPPRHLDALHPKMPDIDIGSMKNGSAESDLLPEGPKKERGTIAAGRAGIIK